MARKSRKADQNTDTAQEGTMTTTALDTAALSVDSFDEDEAPITRASGNTKYANNPLVPAVERTRDSGKSLSKVVPGRAAALDLAGYVRDAANKVGVGSAIAFEVDGVIVRKTSDLPADGDIRVRFQAKQRKQSSALTPEQNAEARSLGFVTETGRVSRAAYLQWVADGRPAAESVEVPADDAGQPAEY